MSTKDMRSIMETIENVEKKSSLKDKVLKTVYESFDNKTNSFWLRLIESITQSDRCHGDGCHLNIDETEIDTGCHGPVSYKARSCHGPIPKKGCH